MNHLQNHPAYQNDSEIARQKTTYTELGENFKPDYTKDRLALQTNSRLNIIKLARKDPQAYEQYIDIVKNDFILISHHRDGYSVFMKRTQYHPERMKAYSHLKRHQEVLYTLTPPALKRKSASVPNRLLVLFSHMNGGGGYDHSNAVERLFVQYFADIQRSLVKNVYVLRIADINLSHGSYFTNTANYPDYEAQIQSLIHETLQKCNIQPENVVLYGGSKGGAGALLHGAIGNYKVVASDPIINSSLYNLKDFHFVKHFKPADLTDIIIGHLKNNTHKMYVFASSAQKFNYEASCNLVKRSNQLINIVDLSEDTAIKTHPAITAQSVPEQITLINLLFDGCKIVGQSLGSEIINRKKSWPKKSFL